MQNKSAVRYGPEVWQHATRMLQAGASVLEVSKALGMTQQAIRSRIKTGSLEKPGKRGRAVAAACEKGRSRVTSTYLDTTIRAEKLQNATPEPENPPAALSLPPGILAALSESASPAEFQKVFSQYAKSLIAQGVAEIAPPTSIRDLATLHGLIYKADGLDKQDKAGGVAPLVNPLRTVSRAATRVIEVEPVPGSAEFEAWEV